MHLNTNRLRTLVLVLAGMAALMNAAPALAQHDEPEAHEHAEHDDHSEHEDEHADEEHAGHDEHEGGALTLAPDVRAELGIEVAAAEPGTVNNEIDLTGEVRLNEDRLAHVVPRLEGIVTEVRAALGDDVDPGEVMAVLDSRDLADLKAAYLAARERLAIAEATYDREKTLFERKVSSEGEYLDARRDFAEARIELRAAQQRLHALGFDAAQLDALEDEHDKSLTRYEILAPIAGSVIAKHITLGEAVSDDAEIYVAADLSTVWVDLSVYPEQLPWVRVGQPVRIEAENYPAVHGEVIYVSPTVDEHTRTALARVLLANPDRTWRPGLFVNGRVEVSAEPVRVKVPGSAVQTIENRPHVFVEHDEGFEAVPVRIGKSDAEGMEILSGLDPGDRYVTRGAFHLKAERDKESFAHAGHAH